MILLAAGCRFSRRCPILILGRKLNEKVHIDCRCGRRTTVMPILAGTERVRLAFDAPIDVKITRAELLEQPAVHDEGGEA